MQLPQAFNNRIVFSNLSGNEDVRISRKYYDVNFDEDVT
jgi:hypothetical protein